MEKTKPRVPLVAACFVCAALAVGVVVRDETGALAARAAGQSLGGDIVAHRDLDYLTTRDYADDHDKLDIFMPTGASNTPVIFFLHGGLLMQDDKGDGEYLAPLVRQGIGVVTANYRLSPAVMHPAHMEDATAAFAWTVEHIASYGGDPGRLYVAGHSAGGYLVALMSLDPSYLRDHGLDFSAIRGTVPISPFLYVEETAPDRPKSVWGTDVEVWKQASVTPYIGPGKPPMLLIAADGDAPWRRAQIERLGRELRAAGNPDVEVVTVADRRHMNLLYRMENDEDPGVKFIENFVRTH